MTSNRPLNNGLFKSDYVLGSHHHLSGMLFQIQVRTQTTNYHCASNRARLNGLATVTTNDA